MTKATGFAALDLFIEEIRASYPAKTSRGVELFVARCRQGTGLHITLEDGCGYEPQYKTMTFDDLVHDGEYLINPFCSEGEYPMSRHNLYGIEYRPRSAELILYLDEGDVAILKVLGLPANAKKARKAPAPKSDIAGLSAIAANIDYLQDAAAEIEDDEDYDFEPEDQDLINDAMRDCRALHAFADAMTSDQVSINGADPIGFAAAVQWHRSKLYVMGKPIAPEVGMIDFKADSQTLEIFEADRQRMTRLTIVAAPATNDPAPEAAPAPVAETFEEAPAALAPVVEAAPAAPVVLESANDNPPRVRKPILSVRR